MVPRLVAFFLASALLVSGAAKKTTATGRGENEDLILNVTIYIDSAAVKEALGDDLGGHYIVAQVKVEPKYTKEIAIDRDDFVLRTDKDGDRTKPGGRQWRARPYPQRRPQRSRRRAQPRLEYRRHGNGRSRRRRRPPKHRRQSQHGEEREGHGEPAQETPRRQGAAGKEDRRAGHRLPLLSHGKPDNERPDRKSTRLNSSHLGISYAV